MPLSKDSITKALSDVRSKTPKRKFTQAIELSVKLREIDLKKPEGRINENLELPTAADKDSKVAVIAGGDLGPRGKMPTPIPPTAPIDDIIKRQRRNVRLKMKDQPVIQAKVGTEDMPDDVLVQNIQTIISRLEAKLEKGPKNIKAVSIKASMGPLVKISLTTVA